MIRLYKETASRLLALAVKARKVDNLTWRQVYDSLSGPIREGSPSTVHVLMNHVTANEPGDDGMDLDSLIETLATQIIEDSGKASHDASLIDTMVRILQLPWARNCIGRSELETLRKAILTDEELTKLKSSLTNRELSCGECHRPLRTGEMVTVIPDGTKSNLIVCHSCIRPDYVACDHCKGSTQLPPYLAKANHRRIDCGCTTRPAAQEQEIVDAPPDVSYAAPPALSTFAWISDGLSSAARSQRRAAPRYAFSDDMSTTPAQEE